MKYRYLSLMEKYNGFFCAADLVDNHYVFTLPLLLFFIFLYPESS